MGVDGDEGMVWWSVRVIKGQCGVKMRCDFAASVDMNYLIGK